MRYYSEETVKKIVKDAMDYSMMISQCIPMSIETYPSIDISEPYGRLGDLDKLKSQIIKKRYEKPSRMREKHYNEVLDILYEAPTILEASK